MTTISTSGIDITKPTSGEATTASVRDNFSAIKDQLDTINGGSLELPGLIVGDPGLEGTGINVNGTTYDSVLKISDIGSSNVAQTILHRHSTTLQPLIVSARSNSDTSSHGTITAAQPLASWYATGWTGSHYDIFGETRFYAGTGTISATSAPGAWGLYLSPDGSTTPAAVITADSDKSVVLAGTLTASNGGSLTGTWSDLGTVTTVDINGGTLDGMTIGATSAPTVTNLGSVATCDINGGTLDGVTIGSTNTFPAGHTVQVVNVTDSAVATGTTKIPFDDTIPQNTEGDEYMTLAITPTSATNKLIIEVVVQGYVAAPVYPWAVALFQDTTANAISVSNAMVDGNAAWAGSCVLRHYMTSGTTSSTTFKVRVGALNAGAGTFTFNGSAGTRLYGGVIGSSITITEVQV